MAKPALAKKRETYNQKWSKSIRLIAIGLMLCLLIALAFIFIPDLHMLFEPPAGLTKMADTFSEPAPGCTLASRNYSRGGIDSGQNIELTYKCNTAYNTFSNFIGNELNEGGCSNLKMLITGGGPFPVSDISGICFIAHHSTYDIGVDVTPANPNDPAFQGLDAKSPVPNVKISGYDLTVEG